MNGGNVTNFDIFGVEYIPKEIQKIIDKKNITKNVYRRKVNDSIMFGYFCIEYIDIMIKAKIFYNIPIFFLELIWKEW